MKRPFYLVGWLFAWAVVFFGVNFYATAVILDGARNKTLVFSGLWWLVAGVVFIDACLLFVFSIRIYIESVKRGFGRLITSSDLRFGKRFSITNSVYDSDYDCTYVMFYCNLHSRICKIGGKKPEGATHVLVAGDSINQRFEYAKVSPETVAILR